MTKTVKFVGYEQRDMTSLKGDWIAKTIYVVERDERKGIVGSVARGYIYQGSTELSPDLIGKDIKAVIGFTNGESGYRAICFEILGKE